MEDLERYGDYNDIEDDMPKGKNSLGIILKIFVGIISFLAIKCHNRIITVKPTIVIVALPTLPKSLLPPNLNNLFSIIVKF